MKIKLQDYSIISNEWIDNEIDRLTKVARLLIADNVNADVYVHTIRCLEGVKEQLIPSEKLAKTCFENGTWMKNGNIDREEYFNSEIEII